MEFIQIIKRGDTEGEVGQILLPSPARPAAISTPKLADSLGGATWRMNGKIIQSLRDERNLGKLLIHPYIRVGYYRKIPTGSKTNRIHKVIVPRLTPGMIEGDHIGPPLLYLSQWSPSTSRTRWLPPRRGQVSELTLSTEPEGFDVWGFGQLFKFFLEGQGRFLGVGLGHQ